MELRQAKSAASRYMIVGLPGSEACETSEILDFVDEISPLGVILFARNMASADSLLALTEALAARFPELVVAIDHEGGRVDRLPSPFTHFPPALELCRRGDPGLLREVARCQATELRAAGFHINFAPVLDIHTNPANPIIGDRAFGTTPEEVVHYALPYAQGLAEGGIASCGKHFPGHGDTHCDSHLELPRIAHDGQRLSAIEMVPFARAIAQGLPMIMTAHIVCNHIDTGLPASLSPTAIDGWLRGRLGFRGVVVSDDLEMKAVAEGWGVAEAGVLAVKAGSDIVLVCNTSKAVRQVHAALTQAIAEGVIGAATLADAEMRRKQLRRRINKLSRISAERADIGAQAHRELASRCA